MSTTATDRAEVGDLIKLTGSVWDPYISLDERLSSVYLVAEDRGRYTCDGFIYVARHRYHIDKYTYRYTIVSKAIK